MLSKKTLDSIASITKLKAEDITAAIADTKEVDLTIEEGIQTFTPAELTARDATQKDAGKSEHIKAGKEIAIKELKTVTGLEFTGKDPAQFITEYKAKVLADAKIPEAEKVTELTSQITILKNNLTLAEQNLTKEKENTAGALRDTRILANLPAERNKALEDQDYLLLIKNRIHFETLDGVEVYKDGKGEIIRDPKTAKPLDLATVVKTTFEGTPGWIGGDPGKPGRGGKSDPPGGGGTGGKPVKYSEAVIEWEAQGKNINQGEFSIYLSGLQAENKTFEMDLPGAPPVTGK